MRPPQGAAVGVPAMWARRAPNGHDLRDVETPIGRPDDRLGEAVHRGAEVVGQEEDAAWLDVLADPAEEVTLLVGMEVVHGEDADDRVVGCIQLGLGDVGFTRSSTRASRPPRRWRARSSISVETSSPTARAEGNASRTFRSV